MTKEEEKKEQEIVKKIQKGDEVAYNDLANEYMPLVLSSVKEFIKIIESRDIDVNIIDQDLFIIYGFEGLVYAINHFDYSKNFRFEKYAIKYIYYSLQNALRFTLRKNRFDLSSLDDMVDSFELNDEEMIDNKTEMNNDYTFLNEFYSEPDLVDQVSDNLNIEVIKRLLKSFPLKTQQIIYLHYGFYNNRCYTFREIASMYNMSANGVHLIVKRALLKIRKKLEFANQYKIIKEDNKQK